MFNKQDYYTEEDAIFANVEADLSYDGADGLCRAIIESYENERLVEAYMDKADAKEAQMLAESASQEDIESLQEASVNSVIQIIIGIMQRFYAKIKGMIARFIHKIQLWFAKRREKAFRRDKKKMDKLIAGKTKGGFKITASRDANGNGNNDITVLANKNKSASGCELLDNFEPDNIRLEPLLTTYFVEDKEKYEYSNTGTHAASDDKEDIYDAILEDMFGKKLSYSDLKSELKDEFFDEEHDITSSDEVVKYLDQAKGIINEVKGLDKKSKKWCNKVAKLGKSAKMKDNAQYIKGLNRLVNLCNTVIFRAFNAVFSLTMEQLNSYFRAYNKLALDSVSISVK